MREVTIMGKMMGHGVLRRPGPGGPAARSVPEDPRYENHEKNNEERRVKPRVIRRRPPLVEFTLTCGLLREVLLTSASDSLSLLIPSVPLEPVPPETRHLRKDLASFATAHEDTRPPQNR